LSGRPSALSATFSQVDGAGRCGRVLPDVKPRAERTRARLPVNGFATPLKRRAPSGRPSRASASGSAVGARQLLWCSTSNSASSTPATVPAAPSSRPGGRRSGRAFVLSQARDTAIPWTSTAAVLAGQHLGLGDGVSSRRRWVSTGGARLGRGRLAPAAGRSAGTWAGAWRCS
jgi:hypothetical protein